VAARSGASSESTYTVRGVSKDPSTISADLGPAGHVSLAFEPSGQREVTRIDLSGKSEKCVAATKVVRRLGNFVGSVSFHGENGYTTAEATSVPGTVGTSPIRNCTTIPKGHPEPDPVAPERLTFLNVSGRAGFFALRSANQARFMALEGENLGGDLLVFRSATAVGEPTLFPFSESGLRASVRPPAPFSGTGVYRATRAGTVTWGGDLSVSFPGVQVPLTGEDMLKPTLRQVGRKGA
jgi:hypothetical protein